MAVTIPFLTSDTNYRLICPLDDQVIAMDVRWNSTDQAWYMDLYEEDDTVIALNIKIVLGVNLGRISNHPFFDNHKITAMDTTTRGIDPGFDDLNARVIVTISTTEDAE